MRNPNFLILRQIKFQFLVGRLKIGGILHGQGNGREFQFLVGRLKIGSGSPRILATFLVSIPRR